MTDNEAHKLVEDAFELMTSKLEQDEITREDIEECKAALVEALEHPDADIWVTMTCSGPKNTLEHHRYPEGRYQWESPESKREALEEITDHEINLTVNA